MGNTFGARIEPNRRPSENNPLGSRLSTAVANGLSLKNSIHEGVASSLSATTTDSTTTPAATSDSDSDANTSAAVGFSSLVTCMSTGTIIITTVVMVFSLA